MFRSGKRPSAGAVTRLALFVSIIAAGTFLGSAMVDAHSPTEKSVLGSANGLTYIEQDVSLPGHLAVPDRDVHRVPGEDRGHRRRRLHRRRPRLGRCLDQQLIARTRRGDPEAEEGLDRLCLQQLRAPQTLTAYGICSDKPSSLEYVHEEVALSTSNDGNASAIAECPAKHRGHRRRRLHQRRPRLVRRLAQQLIARARRGDRGAEEGLDRLCPHEQEKRRPDTSRLRDLLAQALEAQLCPPAGDAPRARVRPRLRRSPSAPGTPRSPAAAPSSAATRTRATRGSTADRPSLLEGPGRRRRAGSPMPTTSARSIKVSPFTQSAPSSPR